MTTLHPVRIATTVLLFLLAAGCGNGGSTLNSDNGSASIVLTDAATDDLEIFEVDVKNITLTKAGGSTVSVLTQSARVDFTELQDVGDLIVGVGLEAGIYTGMSMTLDFANATVCIVGQSTPATVQDGEGNVLSGDVPIAITFPQNARPRVLANRNHLFQLDLDLDQAIAVNTTANTVTFSPIVSLTVDPSNPRPIAMTGILNAVDTTANTLTIEKRTPGNAAIAPFEIATTGSTVFQLNGEVSSGAPGLASLVALIGSRVFVQGSLSTTRRRLTAVAVESGIGTPGNGQDWVFGHITARTGATGADATLTVVGRSLDEPAGTRRFNTVHTVTVSRTATKVLNRATADALNTDALNVGQRVALFGTLTGTSLDATSTSGVARLHRTSVYGLAAGPAVSDTLTLNVNRIGLRPIAAFNFTVSGTQQADPTMLSLDVTGLSASGVSANDKIRGIGNFNPVDVASDDDFKALSFVNVTNQGRLLLCLWLPPRTDAIPSPSGSSFSIDVTNAAIKTVGDGFAPFTLLTSPTPSVEALLGTGLYSIVERGALEVNTDFETFTAALASRISSTSRVSRVAAFGTFDESTQVFKALVVSVVLR